MRKYVTETAEDLEGKLKRAEKIVSEEGLKLYKKEGIKYEFDHHSGDIGLIYVEQTDFSGGKLTHTMLQPLIKRLREVEQKWYVGIMLRGAKHVKNETKIS